MRKAIPILAASFLVWAACDTEGPTQPVDLQPAFIIEDAAHGGGPGFYWLPPMVSQPATTGTFIGTLSPAVDICPLELKENGEIDCGESVRHFEMGTGVEVDVHGQHYQVNWQTDDYDGNPLGAGSYRITVLLAGQPIGNADVDIVSNGSAFKSLDGDVIGLIDGRTLPIKFRIEDGVVEQFGGYDIAYHSTRDADASGCEYNMDVFLMNKTLAVHRNITNSPNTMDGTPSWNPDGTKIVFASNRASAVACGEPDLYIMDLTDGTLTRLTTDGGWKPAWSPDGQWIAFQRGWDPGNVAQNIWIVPANGGTEIQLTDVGSDPDPCEDIDPTWKNNDEVTFSRQGNFPSVCPNPADPADPITFFRVLSVNVSVPASLSWMQELKFGDRDIVSPQWAPDGRLVVQVPIPSPTDPGNLFARGIPGQPGTGVLLTSNPEGDDQNPSWAPNGEEVVFTSFRGGTWGIYYVPKWSDWLTAEPLQSVTPLVVQTGVLNAWAKFRPGM